MHEEANFSKVAEIDASLRVFDTTLCCECTACILDVAPVLSTTQAVFFGVCLTHIDKLSVNNAKVRPTSGMEAIMDATPTSNFRFHQSQDRANPHSRDSHPDNMTDLHPSL